MCSAAEAPSSAGPSSAAGPSAAEGPSAASGPSAAAGQVDLLAGAELSSVEQCRDVGTQTDFLESASKPKWKVT